MQVKTECLKIDKNSVEYPDGYRIVYFYDDHYVVGEYCKTIEGFMIGLSDFDPIIDESDIPPFISNKDLLSRSIKDLQGVVGAAIYKTDGTLITQLKVNKEKTK